MALVTKVMEFKDSDTMVRFLMLYKDLLKPWSEDCIKVMDYIPERKYVKKNEFGTQSITTRGHHDDNIAATCREGYLVTDCNRVKIHIEPEDFKKIQGNFEKVKIRQGQYKYVL